MAHEIVVQNGQALFVAAQGVNAWHGLGTEISGLTREDAARVLNIEDYSKVPEFITWNGRQVATGQYSAVRPSDGKLVGTGLSENYQLHQPRQMFEFIADFLDAGSMKLRTAMFLKGGSVFVTCAEVPAELRVIDGTDGKDAVLPFVTLATAFDGSRATTVRQNGVQTVCANTLSLSDSASSNVALQIRHSSRITPEVVAQAQSIMKATQAAYARKVEWLSELRATELPTDAGILWSAMLGASDVPEREFSYDTWVETQAKAQGLKPGAFLLREIFERHNSENIVIDLLNHSPSLALDSNRVTKRRNGPSTGIYQSWVSSPGQDVRGQSLLRLQGAVTHYVDHSAGRSADTARESAMFGQGARLKATADSLLSEMLAEYPNVASAGTFRTGHSETERTAVVETLLAGGAA